VSSVKFPEYKIYPDGVTVAEQACQRILAAAEKAIAARGAFKIVLAGGTTPEATYRELAKHDSDWSKWHVYIGDERCLPSDDAERNSVMAARSLTNHVSIPTEQMYIIDAEQGAEVAASAYASIVEAALPFDMVLLGMGEDGHTASLFPGHQHDLTETTHAVHNAPKPPSDRISLSASALANTAELLMLITGAGKQAPLAQWRAGEALPIASINAQNTLILMDEAAWPEA